MCAAGWLDQERVAYPTTYSNPLCGFGHVGIVDYGTRKNLSETWDTFCYRMKGERRSRAKLNVTVSIFYDLYASFPQI